MPARVKKSSEIQSEAMTCRAVFVWVARYVAEKLLFLYYFDGHIAFMKRQFLRAMYVERNVSAHASVY